jgi:hypothetical protein
VPASPHQFVSPAVAANKLRVQTRALELGVGEVSEAKLAFTQVCVSQDSAAEAASDQIRLPQVDSRQDRSAQIFVPENDLREVPATQDELTLQRGGVHLSHAPPIARGIPA